MKSILQMDGFILLERGFWDSSLYLYSDDGYSDCVIWNLKVALVTIFFVDNDVEETVLDTAYCNTDLPDKMCSLVQ